MKKRGISHFLPLSFAAYLFSNQRAANTNKNFYFPDNIFLVQENELRSTLPKKCMYCLKNSFIIHSSFFIQKILPKIFSLMKVYQVYETSSSLCIAIRKSYQNSSPSYIPEMYDKNFRISILQY